MLDYSFERANAVDLLLLRAKKLGLSALQETFMHHTIVAKALAWACE